MKHYQDKRRYLNHLHSWSSQEEWTKSITQMLTLQRKYHKWTPVVSRDFDDSVNIACDKFGGSHPFFYAHEQEWPKCKVCGSHMTFLLQASDPSELNIFETLQVFYCRARNGIHHINMKNYRPTDFLIRRINYQAEAKKIAQPKGVEVYRPHKIIEWKKGFDYEFDYSDNEWILEDCPEECFKNLVSLFKKCEDNEAAGPKDTVEWFKWCGKPDSCQGNEYPPYSFQIGEPDYRYGATADTDGPDGPQGFMWGDCGILHVFFDGGNLAVAGDSC